MIDDFDVSEVYQDLMQTYTRTRYTIVNTYDGEVKTPSTLEIQAYIHPDDYKKDVYNNQGQRIEDRIKIFCDLTTDIDTNDEVTYQGKNFKVDGNNYKIVGNYKKLLGVLVG